MTKHETNPWGSSLDKLKEWDPKGAELLLRVGTSPWTSGVLQHKEVELISVGLHSACTSLDEAGRKRSWPFCSSAFRWVFKPAPRACLSRRRTGPRLEVQVANYGKR